MGGSRSSPRSTFWLQRSPRPLSARYYVGTDTFDVTFDRLLTPAVLSETIWDMTPAGRIRQGLIVTADRYMVTGTTRAGLVGPPLDTLSWDPPPFDVTDLQYGVPAEPIVNFPLTVLP